ncbi:MAG: hypothetical protein HYX24_01665 [Candidatus Aenigmarchaeota archaeon]|nr:hypothetical protein [Candidatus Aenigmarchaeota archaeon]
MAGVSISAKSLEEGYLFTLEAGSSPIRRDAHNAVIYLRNIQNHEGLAESDIHFDSSVPPEYRAYFLKKLGFSK